MAVKEMTFKKELQAYERNREHLIANHGVGKYVLICGDEICGVWDTYEDALSTGYSRFGVDTPFMVKKIEGLDGVQFFSRDLKCQA